VMDGERESDELICTRGETGELRSEAGVELSGGGGGNRPPVDV